MPTRKSKSELAVMREAGRLLAGILAELAGLAEPGRITSEFEERAQALLKEREVTSPFQGYQGYPFATCLSVNEEVVHGMPGEHVLRDGDLVGIDLGLTQGGLMVDGAITAGVGEVSEESKGLMAVTKEALRIGVEQAKVGNYTGDIGSAIQRYVEGEGFSVIRSLTGHGIGRELHEPPDVPNFGKAGSGTRLEEGMTICIEPMVAVGNGETVIRPGEWPVRTKDGSHAAHFEHTVVVTKAGPMILTEA